jgi:hypothetical protein
MLMFWWKAKEIEQVRENESAGWLVRGTRARKPHFRGAGVDRWVCVGEWVVVGRVRFAGRWWMVGRIGSHGCRRIPVFCVAGSSSHVLGWCVCLTKHSGQFTRPRLAVGMNLLIAWASRGSRGGRDAGGGARGACCSCGASVYGENRGVSIWPWRFLRT